MSPVLWYRRRIRCASTRSTPTRGPTTANAARAIDTRSDRQAGKRGGDRSRRRALGGQSRAAAGPSRVRADQWTAGERWPLRPLEELPPGTLPDRVTLELRQRARVHAFGARSTPSGFGYT